MTNARQLRNLAFNLSFGAGGVALTLAIAFLLIAVTTQPAQAQTFNVIHNFSNGGDGGSPYAGLTVNGGNLYGTASSGGAGGHGTVYRLKHSGSSWLLNTLYSFTGQFDGDGAYPQARVIVGPDGSLYGTTANGGSGNFGTVFRLRPSARVCVATSCPWTETQLHQFAFYGGGRRRPWPR